MDKTVDKVAKIAIERKRSTSLKAQEDREQRSVVNKAIHKAGGESKIFERIADGVSVRQVLKELGVSWAAFDLWLDRDETRRATLARARELSGHSLADEALEIADAATPADVQVAKLRADLRLKLAGKHDRAYYGEDRGPLVSVNIGDMALDALRRRQVIDE